MSRFDQLEAFVRTVEAGSFTRAAQSLGVDKSAVSRRISDLEARLGVQLLHRSPRALTLTEEGRTLHARAEVLLADLAEAESETRAARGTLRGPLRISVPLSFGLNRLAPSLTAFAGAHPEVALDIDFSDRKVDILAEGFDLAIRGGTLDDSSLRARKLTDVELIAAASPAFLEAYGVPTTVAELSRLPELRYGLRPRTRWEVTTPDGSMQTLDMDCGHRATNGDFLVRAAIAGQGVAIEPDFIIGEAIARGDLVRLLPDHAFPAIAMWAVYPPTRHLSARVRALIDHLVEGCGKT